MASAMRPIGAGLPSSQSPADAVARKPRTSAAISVGRRYSDEVRFARFSEVNATEAGAITVQSCENLLIDTRRVFAAMQVSPTVRVVPLADSTSSALQVSALWGRVGVAGACRVIHSPPTAV